MKARNIIYFFICIIAISCTAQLYIPSSDDVIIRTHLTEGRSLYINHCGNCHNLHLPKEYNRDEWKNYLDNMQHKAKISDDEKKLIYDYLVSHP